MTPRDKTGHAEYDPAPAGSATTVDGALGWRMIGDPPARTASGADRERYGAGVCVTGTCVEPCGLDGGCSR